MARHAAPLGPVAATCTWQLWHLAAERTAVAYLNDASVHEQMVRYAARTMSAGHLPFTSWFPYIGLGSAQYLHYQSLGSVLVGLAGTVVGANAAFSWSTYLLVSLWPLVIYASGRLFGLTPLAAAGAAVAAPFVVSFTGVGYELGAYIWVGGAQVWTQLLGSWLLPLAWAATWRAYRRPQWAWAACGLVSLTTALHFLSGYLAFLGVFVMFAAAGGPWRPRLARASMLFAGSLAASAWVIGPLLLFSKWSSVNQELAATGYVRGYGAKTELGWLARGLTFDARRDVPVLSGLVLVGLLVCLWRGRRDTLGRALPALFGASLLLSFGPTTWHGLADLVPAHADLYFRRFLMGTQLAGIYMAGVAVGWGWPLVKAVAGHLLPRAAPRRALLACALGGGAALCWPAVHQVTTLEGRDTRTIAAQREADATQGAALAPLVEYVKRHGGGRTYAGLGSSWGQSFTVGYVPVYKYLESQDIDEVTYVVPSLSLMLDPEAGFDEDNPADYPIFGVRYIIMPYGMSPPVPAQRTMVSGVYALWSLPDSGYATTVQVQGTIVADRSDIGSRSLAFLAQVGAHQDSAVRWPGVAAPAPSAGQLQPGGAAAPGQVTSVRPALAHGRIGVEVTMHEAGSLLVAIAYDPGWQARANGKPVPVEMLAPAVMGIRLGPGHFRVTLRYRGFGGYPELWGVSVLALATTAWAGRRVAARVAEQSVQDGGPAKAAATCMATPATVADSSMTMRLE